ncbi:MAG: zf-HC2 domain-containing protein [Planctomycetes bacterium]|nr:zf-HC2 domain-containing protein [Planctomycetota bacterium]
MRCEEARLYVYAFHDGALTADKSVVIVEHVKGCDDCRAIYDAEIRLRTSAKTAYERVTLPPGVRERLLSRPKAGRKRMGVAAAAAGLLLALASVIAIVTRKKTPPPTAFDVALALDRTPSSDALRLQTNDDAAARAELDVYVRDRGARPCLHDLTKIGYVHRVGGVVRDLVPGQMHCWTRQEAPDGRVLTHVSVSAGLIPPGDLPPMGQTRIIERGGRTLLVMSGSGFV